MLRIARRIGRFGQRLQEHQIPRQTVEHVLPGARRLRVAQHQRLTGQRRAHDIGDQPVLGEIAAADHVAAPHGGQRRARRLEIRGAVAGHQKLAPRLGGRIGILAAQPVVFREGTAGIVVVIDLVGGDHEHRHPGRMGVDRIQEHAGADDIGAPGLVRVADRAAHQRLGGHVQHQIGLAAFTRRAIASASRISAIWLSVLPAISASSNSDGPGSGASPAPVTFAPMAVSHSAAQPPLNPVWPVRRTRLPFQKAGFGAVVMGVSPQIER
jgi:hypothetical protein